MSGSLDTHFDQMYGKYRGSLAEDEITAQWELEKKLIPTKAEVDATLEFESYSLWPWSQNTSTEINSNYTGLFHA